MREAIRVENISHRFGKNIVLGNINIEFEQGKIHGLFGKNGSGKTTLLSIIANQLIPDSGRVKIEGSYVDERIDELEKVCIVKENNNISSDTRVKDLIERYRSFFNLYDVEYERYLFDKFGFNNQRDMKKGFRTMSRGQKSIIMIVLALASNAEITIFDEPTAGLDERNRKIFYDELIEKYSETGNTFIITTHLIGEIENLIEHAVIIDESKVVVDEDLSDIEEKGFTISGLKEDIEKLDFYEELKYINKIGSTENYFAYRNMDGNEFEEMKNLNISYEKADLKTVFLNMTGGAE